MTPFAQLALTYPIWIEALPFCLLGLAWCVWRWPNCLAALSAPLLNLTRRAYRHPQFAQLQALQQARQTREAVRHFASRLLAYAVLLSLLCVALAQPYRIGKRLPAPERHRDILFLVDTSLNMILRDYVVNGQRIDRMSMLKGVLQEFVQALHGNRIGLSVFSEQVYDVVPFTNDYALLQYQIKRLQAAVLTGRTSDISHALLYSLRELDADGAGDSGAKPVLVLISDAKRTARAIDPRAAAAYLAQRQVRVHTIAIGAGSYAGADSEHQSLIYHPASFYLLEGIAKAGNGEFFWARDQASLTAALQAINAAALREVKAPAQFVHHPLYMWPLGAALLWLTLWQLSALWRRRA